MKTVEMLIWFAVLLIISCSSPDTAGTQTGNPATIGLTYAMKSDGSGARSLRSSTGEVSAVTITEAYLAVSEVRLETSDDALSFRDETPFLLKFSSTGTTGWLDSVSSFVGKTFEEVEIRFDPVESGGEIPLDSVVLVKGYVNDDPLQTFRFTASFTEKIRFRNSFEISSEEAVVQLSVNLSSWFYDADKGEYFDPRSEDNRSAIEGLIKTSFDSEVIQ